MRKIADILCAGLALTLAGLPAASPAQERSFSAAKGARLDPAEIVTARLLPGWTTPQGTRMAALHLTLQPGWKTYWRAPGEAGIPPRFDWAGSRNLASVSLHWPSPHVFYLNGMQSIGYKGDLVLPIEFTPKVAGAPMELAASIDIGVCRDICVPVSLMLGAEVSDGEVGAASAGGDAAIRAALKARPLNSAEAGLVSIRCDIAPIADGLRLTAEIGIASSGGAEVGVVELADPAVWVAEASTRRSGDRLIVQTDLVPENGAPFLLDRSDLRITILGQDQAVDLQGCPAG